MRNIQRVGSNCIHALKRLVEKQYFWAVNHRGGQREFFLHPVRIVRHQRFRLVHQLHEIQQFRGAFCGSGAIEPIHATDKIQILGAGEPPE